MVENAVIRMTSVSGDCSLMRRSTRQAVAVGQLEIEQHEVDAGRRLLERLRGGAGLEDRRSPPARVARAATSAAALRHRRSDSVAAMPV